MLGILYTFWCTGFVIFYVKGSFLVPRVMWAKCSPGVKLKTGPCREDSFINVYWYWALLGRCTFPSSHEQSHASLAQIPGRKKAGVEG